jgi:hypothetical protein
MDRACENNHVSFFQAWVDLYHTVIDPAFSSLQLMAVFTDLAGPDLQMSYRYYLDSVAAALSSAFESFDMCFCIPVSSGTSVQHQDFHLQSLQSASIL